MALPTSRPVPTASICSPMTCPICSTPPDGKRPSSQVHRWADRSRSALRRNIPAPGWPRIVRHHGVVRPERAIQLGRTRRQSQNRRPLRPRRLPENTMVWRRVPRTAPRNGRCQRRHVPGKRCRRLCRDMPDARQLRPARQPEEIAVPTAIAVGEEDYATPPAMANDLHAAVKHSTLTIIKAGGISRRWKNPTKSRRNSRHWRSGPGDEISGRNPGAGAA